MKFPVPIKPRPYYERNGITIYHGDCREILPKLGRFDLLLTDPPYGINEAAGKNKSRGKAAISIDYGNDDWDKSPPSKELINLIISIADKSIVFGGNYFYLPPSSCWIVWNKDNGSTDFADCELAWSNLKSAVRMFTWKWQGMLQQNMKEKEKRFHPTQKPVPVMRFCIEQAKDIRTIIDPFVGSGTTLLAAKELKLKCIGIEREEKYCEIAAIRLQQEILI